MARKSRKLPESPKSANKIFNTAVYSRISNDTERAGDSIETQITLIKNYLSEREDFKIYSVYADLGISGTGFERPEYLRMSEDIKNGKVNCVIVKDISRLGRNYISIGELIFETFIKYNVRFISINDNYDSFSETADRQKLLLLFKNLINHMYSKDLGKKISSSLSLKQQKGEPIGANPPYGYIFSDTRKLIIEPESAKIVKYIFDMRLKGYSTIKITEQLNIQNINSPGNHYFNIGLLKHIKYSKKIIWNNSYICKLLTNEIYTGVLIQNKYKRIGRKFIEKPQNEWIYHNNNHPAIVTKNEFNDVQNLMRESRKKFKKKGNTFIENIFAGKLYCARCGKAAKRGHSGTEKSARYHCLSCNNEIRKENKLKSVPQIKLSDLENVVIESINKQIELCIEKEHLFEEITKNQSLLNKNELLVQRKNKLAQKEKTMENMISRDFMDFTDNLLNEYEFDLARRKFESDRQEIEKEMKSVDAQLEKFSQENIRKNEWLSNFKKFENFKKLDKSLISLLIKEISMTPLSNEINIEFNFQDSFNELTEILHEVGGVNDAL